jgi:hypothetical protein
LWQSSSSSNEDNDSRVERKKIIFEEEMMNADALKESAKAWQNMKPQDIDVILSQMDQMSQVEKDKLKEMGMDPDLMKISMKMMKEDPEMMKSVGKMMETMTPEQLAAQSRIAQEQMKQLSPDFFKEAAKVQEEAAATIVDDEEEDDDEEEEDDDDEEQEPVELGSTDPTVIDSMFQVAQLMSQPPSGGVTFQAFSTLPPITILSGEGSEDLTSLELKECWADGSLGATRVDRAGFERVWTEIQACFSIDIMEEARKTCHSRKKKSVPEPQRPASAARPAAPSSTPAAAARPVVGAGISPEQLAKEVKNMSEQDLVNMLDQMDNMTPQQAAQMKAMGGDPEMMKKAASMMKNNPLMRKAATMMMKNTPPEKLMEASRQAQQKMANMSPEELKKAMDDLDKTLK